jgi:hypothetical protein
MSLGNGVVAKAKLLSVGGTFGPSERSTVIAGAVEILRGRGGLTAAEDQAVSRLAVSDLRSDDRPAIAELLDQLTGADLRVVKQALGLSHFGPTRQERAVASELLRRIAEAAAIVEARRLAADAALDAKVLAQLALRRAKNPDQVEGRNAEFGVAEEAHRFAHEAHERAQAALVTLYCERDNRARAAQLEALTTE